MAGRAETDIAWAAGLFEGEGCIHLNSQRYLWVSLASTDQDVLERFCRIVGVGSARPKKKARPHHKPSWQWQVTGGKGVHVLRMLLPELGERRGAAAKDALARGAYRAYCEPTQGPQQEGGGAKRQDARLDVLLTCLRAGVY